MASKGRRVRGEGSIYKRAGDGLWVGMLDLGIVDGRRRRKTVSGQPSVPYASSAAYSSDYLPGWLSSLLLAQMGFGSGACVSPRSRRLDNGVSAQREVARNDRVRPADG